MDRSRSRFSLSRTFILPALVSVLVLAPPALAASGSDSTARRAGPATPPDSPKTMEDVMGSPLMRDLMTSKLNEGDAAYAFTLPQLDARSGHARPTGRSVSLAAFRGRKPVALIFGSYT